MSNPNESPTNRTTRLILDFLFGQGVYAWRHNVLPIPIYRAGQAVGFRPGSKLGLPDIMGIIPAGLLPDSGIKYGVPLWIEVKTGHDRLRPEQIGAHANARKMGTIVMVIKDFEDFKQQWNNLFQNQTSPPQPTP